jgi:hypothetical protein
MTVRIDCWLRSLLLWLLISTIKLPFSAYVLLDPSLQLLITSCLLITQRTAPLLARLVKW